MPNGRDDEAAGPRDACGVFGVRAPREEVAKLTYFGLYALQHRGQESAGISVGNGERIVVCKNMGLVSQVFDEATLESLSGHIAVGHCRYSTTGSSTWENAQPTFRHTDHGGMALGHNGNLTNSAELAATVADLTADSVPAGPSSALTQPSSSSDTALIGELIAAGQDEDLLSAAQRVLPLLRGAFCLVFMDADRLYAARDPQGIHPLVLGRLPGDIEDIAPNGSAPSGASGTEDGQPPSEPDTGWVVASETAALDIVGATFVREIEPGELVVIDESGPRSYRFAEQRPAGCLFEFVYLARPDTQISGRSLHASRVEAGRRLAREHPAEADLVIPVPESGTPAAVGYAEESGIPYGLGLVKNSYVGRTFIQPSQTLRQLGVRLKLNPLRDVIEGKRLVVVDDSIVRGTSQRALVRMLRQAGAAEVHIRISSPPVRWPCFYGIDFAQPEELIANQMSVEQIAATIGADSLGYISLDGLVAASTVPAEQLCRACFDGVYPVEIPESARRHGKLQLERT